MRGAVDNLTTTGAVGWYYSLNAKKAPDIVDAVLFGRILGEAPASLERPDLEAAGFGDGAYGFAVDFYAAIPAAHLPFVKIRPQKSDLELPRTNLTGFPDFMREMHERFPGAGVQKSVFGGLWTDRLDARRRLQGKTRSGAIHADLLDRLRCFIDDGYVVIELAHAIKDLVRALQSLSSLTDRGTLSLPRAEAFPLEAISGVLFEESLLQPLMAILEDAPIFYRPDLNEAGQDRFHQASASSTLPAPNECIQLLCSVGERPVEIQMIAGSHQFPEFSENGRSRWVSELDDNVLLNALRLGASVDTVPLRPDHLAMVAPGMIYRAVLPPGALLMSCMAAPARLTPANMIIPGRRTVRLEHASGAAFVG